MKTTFICGIIFSLITFFGSQIVIYMYDEKRVMYDQMVTEFDSKHSAFLKLADKVGRELNSPGIDDDKIKLAQIDKSLSLLEVEKKEHIEGKPKVDSYRKLIKHYENRIRFVDIMGISGSIFGLIFSSFGFYRLYREKGSN